MQYTNVSVFYLAQKKIKKNISLFFASRLGACGSATQASRVPESSLIWPNGAIILAS